MVHHYSQHGGPPQHVDSTIPLILHHSHSVMVPNIVRNPKTPSILDLC